MENILKELGFTHFTGPLWRHDEVDIIIGVAEKDKPSDLVKKIFKTGKWYGQREKDTENDPRREEKRITNAYDLNRVAKYKPNKTE